MWILACQQKVDNLKNAKICSLHFKNEDFSLKEQLLEIPLNKRKLNSTAFPTENLPEGGLNMKSLEREERAELRNRKRTVLELLRNNEQENCSADQEIQEEIIAINARDMSSQTEYDMESMRELKIMQLEKKLKEKDM